ncbi:Family of unknown function [Chryseolinea serpens]|uniref:DUF695 domain-containing protein n=1 Tax=Chryseolinea serpens TaxID=947013 RepID=A0A1M5S318_9BACT|nr:DUF695 domain-containing protein [Chryseolinea serpens]SHH32846.1 Family of unknown function [Chryseolinea serpens]
MSILKRLFGTKQEPIRTYQDFWKWFQENERGFFKAVKNQKNIEKEFFDKLSPKLNELQDGFFYLTGMLDENTVELILTPDGNIKNIVFVEELVHAAPAIPGWTFTSLKPPMDITNVRIDMAGYTYDSNTLSFYPNDVKDHPDEIDITIVHKDYHEDDKSSITNGTYIFLDNFIGELNSVTTIDNVKVIGRKQAEKDLIPIEKLKDFLLWRQKEFIEKYEGTLQNTDTAEFAILEAELESGNKLIATINTDILHWNKKASHPWIATLEIPYDGQFNNGMPDEKTYQLLNEIEERILEQLKDSDGYLNIGRQTADSLREVYFACKDFRKPSKVLHQLTKDYPTININYDIYKDKYWRSFNRFNNN